MKRIVVVDDEPGVGVAIRDLLATDGYAVEAPGDARSFVSSGWRIADGWTS